MTPITTSPYAQAVAWALVHFVWQGSAIGLAALLCLRFARVSAVMRYRIGVIALGAMTLAPVATIVVVKPNLTCPACVGRMSAGSARPEGLAYAPGASAVARTARADRAAISASPLPSPLSPRTLVALLALWGAGVVLFAARLAGGWIVARRWARRVAGPASAEIQVIAARLAERLALARVTRVYESAAARVPMVVGWLRPVILLPAAAIGGLSLVQLEALLAHELAHVRRHDYLVNLLQSVVETLLFYHPAVWWVSREVREAREQCCDDLAVLVCGDRLVYASALTELAIMMKPRLALAATDGSLAARVRRILGEPHEAHHRSGVWAPAVLAILLGAALVPAGAASRAPDDDVQPANEMVAAQATQESAAERAKQEAAARVERQKLVDEQVRQQEIKLEEERKAQQALATERASQKGAGILEQRKLADEQASQELRQRAERKVQEERQLLEWTSERARQRAVELEAFAHEQLRNPELLRETANQQLETGQDRVTGLRLKVDEYEAAKLRVEYQQAQLQYEALRQKYAVGHPDVQAAIARIAQLEAQLMDLRARDSAVRLNSAAIPGGTISLLYGETPSPSSMPLVRINDDGTVDDLGLGTLFGPLNLSGLSANQALDALVKAVMSQPERLVEGKQIIGITLVLRPVK